VQCDFVIETAELLFNFFYQKIVRKKVPYLVCTDIQIVLKELS